MPERTVRLRAVFEHSRNAMLIADDQRHFRDANDAACRLLGAPRGWILNHRIDDVTPAEQRPAMDEIWTAFLKEGTQAGQFELQLPDGRREAVDYSATANIVPGMHLSILLPLVPGLPEPGIPEGESTALTRREAQVMGLIALGSNTEEIAERLAITQETARSHAKNAMRKLGARSRAHAVALALARGELTLS
ncbi:MAG TPA: LuxR C-terminal-related transcriptional regulator [Thermoleophilaceae bacterium]